MKDQKNDSLGDALPREMARVRELLPLYASIGAPGAFAMVMMQQALGDAERAMISGDLPGMIAAYQELKEFSA